MIGFCWCLAYFQGRSANFRESGSVIWGWPMMSWRFARLVAYSTYHVDGICEMLCECVCVCVDPYIYIIIFLISLTKNLTLHNQNCWTVTVSPFVWPPSRFSCFLPPKIHIERLRETAQVAVPSGSITGFKDVDSQDMDALMQAVSKQPVSASWWKMGWLV